MQRSGHWLKGLSIKFSINAYASLAPENSLTVQPMNTSISMLHCYYILKGNTNTFPTSYLHSEMTAYSEISRFNYIHLLPKLYLTHIKVWYCNGQLIMLLTWSYALEKEEEKQQNQLIYDGLVYASSNIFKHETNNYFLEVCGHTSREGIHGGCQIKNPFQAKLMCLWNRERHLLIEMPIPEKENKKTEY